MLLWLFPQIEITSAILRDFNHQELTNFEDSGIVNFSIGNGLGTFNYSTSCYDENLESSITIIAENGSVKVGGQYMNIVEYCNIKNYTMPELKESEPANDYGAYKGSASNHHKVYENVLDVLLRDGKITTTPEQELKVIETIEKIYSWRF
jgi:predicted dehydrogenase